MALHLDCTSKQGRQISDPYANNEIVSGSGANSIVREVIAPAHEWLDGQNAS